MKNKCFFIIIAISFVVISCTNTIPQNEKEFEYKDLPIEKIVNSFVTAHPDYNRNDITRDEANKKFIDTTINIFKTQNILEGIPVKLVKMNKRNGKCYAQFQSWGVPDYFQYRYNIHEIHFDAVGVISDSIARSLVESEYYSIEGKFVKRLKTMSELQSIIGIYTYAYTPSYGIEQDDIWREKINVNLGLLHYNFSSVKLFLGREEELNDNDSIDVKIQ